MPSGAVSDIFLFRNERLNTEPHTSDSASNMKIETIEDLKAALKEVGYSNKAITEILKWYTTNCTIPN